MSEFSWTVRDASALVTHRLSARGAESAALEASLLVAEVLGMSRAAILTHPERLLTEAESETLLGLLARREAGEPLAYIVGRREFFGLDFLVDSRALIPRPETEILVEEALWLARGLPSPQVVADVGAGSGAIAVAVAHSLPEARVYALDISEDALNLARENAKRLEVEDRITFLRSDLLGSLPERVSLILANLPYVSQSELGVAQPELHFEPRLALDGGADGLALYRRLFAQVGEHLLPSGSLLIEIGAAQGSAARRLAESAFPGASIRLIPDLAGLDRVLVVTPARKCEICHTSTL